MLVMTHYIQTRKKQLFIYLFITLFLVTYIQYQLSRLCIDVGCEKYMYNLIRFRMLLISSQSKAQLKKPFIINVKLLLLLLHPLDFSHL